MNNTSNLPESAHIVEIVAFTTLGVILAIINLIVFIAGFYVKGSITTCSKISMNISLTGVLVGALLSPFHGQGDAWLLGDGVCSSFLTLHSFWRTATMSFISTMVLESYIQLRRHCSDPDETRDSKSYLNPHMTIFLVWSSSGVVAFLTFIVISTTNNTLCISYQHIKKEFMYFYIVFVMLLPLIVLAGLNISYLRLTSKYIRSIGVYAKHRRRNVLKDLQYAKCAFRLFQVVLITWIPYIVYMLCILNWNIETIYFDEISYKVVKTLQWLCYLSCLLHPIVILHYNKQLKTIVVTEVVHLQRVFFDERFGEERIREVNEPPQTGTQQTPSPGLRRKAILKLQRREMENSETQSSANGSNTDISML